ncbi:hypothetical protein DPSP01_012611 [Paraphaeosphaeria sporulosa]
MSGRMHGGGKGADSSVHRVFWLYVPHLPDRSYLNCVMSLRERLFSKAFRPILTTLVSGLLDILHVLIPQGVLCALESKSSSPRNGMHDRCSVSMQHDRVTSRSRDKQRQLHLLKAVTYGPLQAHVPIFRGVAHGKVSSPSCVASFALIYFFLVGLSTTARNVIHQLLPALAPAPQQDTIVDFDNADAEDIERGTWQWLTPWSITLGRPNARHALSVRQSYQFRFGWYSIARGRDEDPTLDADYIDTLGEMGRGELASDLVGRLSRVVRAMSEEERAARQEGLRRELGVLIRPEWVGRAEETAGGADTLGALGGGAGGIPPLWADPWWTAAGSFPGAGGARPPWREV